MDETDLKILKILIKNPQQPYYKISKKIGLSQRCIQKRIQKMHKKNIIIQSTIIIDLTKLGYQGRAQIMINNQQGYSKNITIQALKQIPNIFIITETIGEFDLIAIAAVKDYPNLIKMVNTIKQLPSVANTKINLVTEAQFPITTEFNKQLDTETLKEEILQI